MGRHFKETVPRGNFTWSEMGKQNIQAKKVLTKRERLPTLKNKRLQDICIPMYVDKFTGG